MSAESLGRADSKDEFAADERNFVKSVAMLTLYVSGSRETGNASAGALRSCNVNVLRLLFVVFGSPGSRTLGPSVAQQRSIASSDHRMSIAQQGHDGMAG